MSDPFFSDLTESIIRAFEADDLESLTKRRERSHVESLRRQVAAIGAGDFESCLREFDSDIELEIHCPADFPFVRRARGVEQVRAAIAHNFAAVEAQMPRILHVVGQGDIIDITLTETGRIKATGQPYDVATFQQFIFGGGKLVRFREIVCHRTPEE
jgi:ketosteroid isomerase-like protein